jgi:sterol 14-demethylase
MVQLQQETRPKKAPGTTPTALKGRPPAIGRRRPGLGHTLEFLRDPLALLARGQREHGPIFRFDVAGKNFVCFAGPAAHQAYFGASETVLSARDVYQFTIPIFGKGVAYDAPWHVFKEQLTFLYPALRDGRMRTYAKKMQAEAEAYFSRWQDGQLVNLPVAFNELTVSNASRCLLGDEMRERVEEEFADAYHDLQAGINAIGFFAPNAPIPAHRRRDKARRKVVDVIGRLVRDRRQSGRRGEDFLQSIMDARYKDGRALTEDEVTGILLTVLFGGQHTSAVLATWAGLLLAQHPQHLESIRAEIDAVYPDGIDVTLDTLKRQTRLDHAIREAERMHPPLIILVRKVLEPFAYEGYELPVGTFAMVSPGMSHRLPDVFKNPHAYDPDRFAPPRSESDVPHSLIGFGGGKHRCVGMHFAYMQLKTIFSVLLSQFALELVRPMPSPDFTHWVTGPKEPCEVRVVKRR